jgi:hypothetical protein
MMGRMVLAFNCKETPRFDKVLDVPEEQSTFHNLKVIAVKAACQVGEEHRGDLQQLICTKQVQDFFQFIQEHDLLATAALRPALEEAIQDGRGHVGIFFHVLDSLPLRNTPVHKVASRFS